MTDGPINPVAAIVRNLTINPKVASALLPATLNRVGHVPNTRTSGLAGMSTESTHYDQIVRRRRTCSAITSPHVEARLSPSPLVP